MADRGMSAAMLAEIAKSQNITCLLVEMYFDSGTFYHAMCGMDIVWGGNTYLAGNVLSITPAKESIEDRVGTITLELSGVPLANVSQALTEAWIDRQIIIRRALLNSTTYAVLVDPVEMFNGRFTSHPDIIENYELNTANISWEAASHWADFERITGRRTNHEDQQIYFPGDMGFEFASEIIKDIPWGRV